MGVSGRCDDVHQNITGCLSGLTFGAWAVGGEVSFHAHAGAAPPILMWSGSGNGHASSPTPRTKFDQDNASGSNSSFPATKITNPGTVCLV